jgi:ATP-dependent Lon protease
MTTPESELIEILTKSSTDQDSASNKPNSKSLPNVLPILGLADIVIFPAMTVPLVVESAASIRLVDDVVAGDRFLGMILQKNAAVDNPTPEELFEHGCAARVIRMLKFPDNTVRILVEGLRRFKVKKYESQAPYLRAEVEWLDEEAETSIEMTALTRNVQQIFEQVVNLSPTLSDQIKVSSVNTEDSSKLADLIAPNLNLNLEERQHLLSIANVKERLTRLLPLLSRELEVLNLGSKIQKDVANTMSKSQRDYFLREQLRAIQRELGEGDSGAAELSQLRAEIEKNNLPEEARVVAFKELDRLQQMPQSMPEYTVTRNYLDWLIQLPWSKSTEDKLDIREAERILNEQHYGLKKVKDRLLEYLAVIKLSHKIKGPLLCLVGPPGVGKTSLGKSVADALGRKFIRIALGGMRDEAEIRGHRRTYVGALPGRIIQSLRRAGTNNPVILLDELDKVGSDFRGDPSSALLEVLDPQQNNTFTDHYLDLPFDLSRVLFITTANWLDPIHVALRDRLEVIELPSYTAVEKFQIARRHLIPRQLEEHGVKVRQIRFSDAALKQLIEDYTRESGVRQLEREIGSLVRKSVRKMVDGRKKPSMPIIIEAKSLTQMLGSRRFFSESAQAIDATGIATGLAWTPVGGEILFIEATRMPGRGQLILTGSLGEVMKESAQTALSFLRSQAAKLKIDLTDYDKFDIHVHVPAGATPKDGPSAGVTIATALASLFLKRCVHADLAMTGEISLRGRVMPVGGIKEKVLAASRSGIKRLILPEQNRRDWNEVPIEVRRTMKVRFVRHIPEVFATALCPIEPS